MSKHVIQRGTFGFIEIVKTGCLTHTDSTYKLDVGVENVNYVVKYLSITPNTSWEPQASGARAFSEVVSVMI